jgi:hypothetical protein
MPRRKPVITIDLSKINISTYKDPNRSVEFDQSKNVSHRFPKDHPGTIITKKEQDKNRKEVYINAKREANKLLVLCDTWFPESFEKNDKLDFLIRFVLKNADLFWTEDNEYRKIAQKLENQFQKLV